MQIDILSLFPEYFKGPLDESILKRAQAKGLISISQTNIRDFTHDAHHRVDDRPYGGGPGMVMMAKPVVDAIRHHRRANSRVIYLSPQGPILNHQKCVELAQYDHLILLCGHYEGIDERALKEVDEEVSIGNYVLTNGCLAAIVLIDSVSRFIPGVLGDDASAVEDSFSKDILDHPHYTRPEIFEGDYVPEVLLKGNHKEIDAWRKQRALEKTFNVKPELYHRYLSQVNHQNKFLNNELSASPKLSFCIEVENLKKSVAFYRKIIGLSLLDCDDENKTALFLIGNTTFKIIEGRKPLSFYGCLCLQFKDLNQFTRLHQRLVNAAKVKYSEIEFKTRPHESALFTFCDPEGILWTAEYETQNSSCSLSQDAEALCGLSFNVVEEKNNEQ